MKYLHFEHKGKLYSLEFCSNCGKVIPEHESSIYGNSDEGNACICISCFEKLTIHTQGEHIPKLKQK